MVRYQIVHDPAFDSELERISDLRRADDFIRGVELILACHPESGVQISQNVWSVKTADDRVLGRAVVYYTFDEKNVLLLSIRSEEFK